MQRGFTLLELMISLSVLTIISSVAMVRIDQSMARQELETASRQLVSDIHWLQQISLNSANNTTSYIMLFNQDVPYGYYITANTQTVRKVVFPQSVTLAGSNSYIGFSLTGVPRIGAQTISLYSPKLKAWKYVILAPVTGRVRISDYPSSKIEE